MSLLEDLAHELEYPCRGVVTDMDAALCRAVEVVYPEKPHQYCLKHALAALELSCGGRPLRSWRDIGDTWCSIIVSTGYQGPPI